MPNPEEGQDNDEEVFPDSLTAYESDLDEALEQSTNHSEG